jgi:DNA polymerase I-like protein with 3'-5' exonuclease and polymerase domains
VECLEDQAEEVSSFVERVMVEIINPGLDDFHPDRVPVEVDVKVVSSWAEQRAKQSPEAEKLRGK